MKPTYALAALAATLVLPHVSFSAESPAAPVRFELTLAGSGTARGDTEFAGRTEGSASVVTGRASFSFREALTDRIRYTLGVGFAHVAIDATGSVPLPERLQSEFAELGLSWEVAPNWTLIASIRPGLYSDTEASSSDAFAVPGILLAQRKINSQWTVGGGVRVSQFDRNEVMPIAFFRWQPSPEWSFSFGAPRTEAAYHFGRKTTFFAGAAIEGGAFAVDDPAVIAPAGYRSLRDTKLDYREVRVGAGVRHQVSPALRLQFEVGAAVDRRFDYHERSLKIEADTGFSGALSIVSTF